VKLPHISHKSLLFNHLHRWKQLGYAVSRYVSTRYNNGPYILYIVLYSKNHAKLKTG